jgi:predicted DNA-binding protein (UPF0251 family)/predicted Fe-Mo cluster-binding NifX family protein
MAPKATYFKPRGVPLSELAEVYVSMESLEALRLVDLEGLTMEAAAARMRVSRHTLGRVIADGRRAVADALVNGLALRIEGGDYAIESPSKACLALEDENMSAPALASARNDKEHVMSKIAITSEGPGLDSMMDSRFGRAAGFVVVDLETMDTRYVDNGASQALAQGAGIQAASSVASAGAEVLLTGFVGPKAFTALSAAGIKVGQNLEGMSVRQAVERFKAGQVSFADKPNR